MKYYLPLLLFALCIASCANGDHPGSPFNFENIERLDTDTKASDLVGSYSFVTLSPVPGGGFLNYLTKAAFDEGIFFIREGQVREGLFLFDESGRHLRHLTPDEEGTNPFASIDDFSLDEANDRIYLLSKRSRRIGVLDYQLNLLDTIDLHMAANAIAYLDDHLILASPNDEKVIHIIDLDGKELSGHFTDNLSRRPAQFMPLDKNEHFVLYHHWEDNQVFKIIPPGEVAPYFSLTFNQETPAVGSPIASVNKIGKRLILSLKGRNIPMSVLIHDLESRAIVRINKLNNDVSLNKNFLLPIIGKHESQLITYLPGEYLLEQAQPLPATEINGKLSQVLNRLEVDSNPVLVLMELR
jgi:hypothetical protein